MCWSPSSQSHGNLTSRVNILVPTPRTWTEVFGSTVAKYFFIRERERLALPEYLFLSIDDFLLRRIVEFLTLVRGSVGLLLVVLGLVLLALDDHDDDGDDEDEGDHGPDDDGEEEVGAGQSLLLHYLQSSN